MVVDTSPTIEEAFAKDMGISIFATMKILNDAGVSTEDMSDITNKCRNVLTDEIERRNVPYEYRFLLLSLILCRMLKTATDFNKEYMKFVEKRLNLSKDVLDNKDISCSDIEFAKDP